MPFALFTSAICNFQNKKTKLFNKLTPKKVEKRKYIRMPREYLLILKHRVPFYKVRVQNFIKSFVDVGFDKIYFVLPAFCFQF